MILLALSTLCCRISRRSLLAIGVEEIFALKERELYAVRLCLFWSQVLSKLFRKSLKFLTNRDIPASFKWNLLLQVHISHFQDFIFDLNAVNEPASLYSDGNFDQRTGALYVTVSRP